MRLISGASTYSANSLHRQRHQPCSSHPHRSASCHPDVHGQASEILWPHRLFRFRRGPQAGPQRWHRRPAEGLETTSRSSSTNVAAYNRKRPETTEPGWVCGLPGTEHMIVNCGVKSGKRQRSCRGMLHNDDEV